MRAEKTRVTCVSDCGHLTQVGFQSARMQRGNQCCECRSQCFRDGASYVGSNIEESRVAKGGSCSGICTFGLVLLLLKLAK